ncbi:rhodanese-like domain-containing protein [Mangrovimonas cancribranchiae]|uniref:Rhodanese-like domain-containing protein n=1 Tax=Mangrovimonas cancribranchiae TaxID=3080055 RepID=A0AAU6P9B2_9FLAO
MSFLSTLFSSKSQDSKSVVGLSSEEFKAQIEHKKVQLIDVRTPREFKSGCIKKAKNIDFFSGAFNKECLKLDKGKPVYVYCRSGNRSRKAANKLAKMGFTKIYDLNGGILRYN